jgi:hypothetical protein
MEKALEDLELHKGGAEFSIRKTAERYGLSRTTLQRNATRKSGQMQRKQNIKRISPPNKRRRL